MPEVAPDINLVDSFETVSILITLPGLVDAIVKACVVCVLAALIIDTVKEISSVYELFKIMKADDPVIGLDWAPFALTNPVVVIALVILAKGEG